MISDCWFPQEGIASKFVSTRLYETMPVVRQYVQNYQITNDHIYDIQASAGLLGNYEDAVCEYLKNNVSIILQILHGHLHIATTPQIDAPTDTPSPTYPMSNSYRQNVKKRISKWRNAVSQI